MMVVVVVIIILRNFAKLVFCFCFFNTKKNHYCGKEPGGNSRFPVVPPTVTLMKLHLHTESSSSGVSLEQYQCIFTSLTLVSFSPEMIWSTLCCAN